MQVDLWFWKRPATQRDIRQILANIRQLRLKVTFVSQNLTIYFYSFTMIVLENIMQNLFLVIFLGAWNFSIDC